MDILCREKRDVSVEQKSFTRAEEEKIIVCAFCNNHITDMRLQMIVNDSFYHVFANPHGLVFEIGCFTDAKGCVPGSIASTEFTWFAGFSWQIGACSRCSSHLGWIFSSDSDQFYGLILEKLMFP